MPLTICIPAYCSAHNMLKAPAVPGLPSMRLQPRQRPARLMWLCRRQLTHPRRQHTCLASATEHTAAAAVPLEQAEVQPIADTQLPSAPGVYAVYDGQDKLQYIGISRRVAASLQTHARDLPELAVKCRVACLEDPSKENLTSAWQAWVQEAADSAGGIPPGNMPGNKQWSSRRKAKPELRLTPGKGVQDLTCSVTDLLDQVVKGVKVVAFVKGTRTAPQCGFSYKVLTTLMENRADFEVVNVLDDVYNPGLREAIKEFSEWPTIPQLYIGGEFIGGADVVEELQKKGELKDLLQKAGAV